jgi:hypothetical protein
MKATLTWVRAEIRRLDKNCRQATTKAGIWYCLGKRAGLRAVRDRLAKETQP